MKLLVVLMVLLVKLLSKLGTLKSKDYQEKLLMLLGPPSKLVEVLSLQPELPSNSDHSSPDHNKNITSEPLV